MSNPTTIRIVVFLLWISIILSLVLNFNFDTEFILGIVSLLIVSIILAINKLKKYGLPLLLLFLFSSIFNVITFSYGFTIGILPGVLPINIVSFLLFSILVYRHRKDLNGLFVKNELELTKSRENKVNFFKHEFQDVASEELVSWLHHDKLSYEAKIAITLILKERDVTMNNFMDY